jgi:hypothetical protein
MRLPADLPLVRDKDGFGKRLHDPSRNGGDASYRRYHAELFPGQEVSCWEKHQMEQKIARDHAYAA